MNYTRIKASIEQEIQDEQDIRSNADYLNVLGELGIEVLG